MDEELLKRNTDCVYFLASPLTCKKGIDCEYRHSEIARLNPRECWYWLSGSCLNPTCAFRHPPLDGHTGATLESAPSSVAVNKTNVPCYYYFNGYCNKGDRCSFLHDVDADSQPGGKLVQTTSASLEVLQVENNNFTGSDLGSAPTNGHLNTSATTKVEVDTEVQPKEEFQIPVLKDVQNQSSSPQISVSEDEETATIRSDSLPPAAAFVHSIVYACEDHVSEEQVDDQTDREERWESSPGFDVLVDGEAENLDSEDDQDYIMAPDRGRRELNGHFSGYDFEIPDDYNSNYPDMVFHYESEMFYQYDPPVGEDSFGDTRNVPCHTREKMIDSILSHKRKLMAAELGLNNRDGDDLRDHLRRRRFIDSHSVPGLSRTYESSRLIGRSRERSWQHGTGNRQRHKRFASEVGRYTVESLGKNGIYANGGRRHSFSKHSQEYRPMKQYKEKRITKRRRLSSEVSRKMGTNGRSNQESSRAFLGPKTLAQIKKEKIKAEGNGDSTRKMGHYRRPTSTDFKGPRPLSDILKDKRKLNCENEGNTDMI